jgi:hypothetical protein
MMYESEVDMLKVRIRWKSLKGKHRSATAGYVEALSVWEETGNRMGICW